MVEEGEEKSTGGGEGGNASADVATSLEHFLEHYMYLNQLPPRTGFKISHTAHASPPTLWQT